MYVDFASRKCIIFKHIEAASHKFLDGASTEKTVELEVLLVYP